MYTQEGMLDDIKYLFKFFNFVSFITGLILISYVVLKVYTNDSLSIFLTLLSPAVGSYLQSGNITYMFFKEILLIHIISLIATLFLFIALYANDSYDFETVTTDIYLVINLIWFVLTLLLVIILVLIALFMIKEKQ